MPPYLTHFLCDMRCQIVFYSGGVWIIGYKAWGAFMGKLLAANGVCVVMPDYRNFPQVAPPHTRKHRGCIPRVVYYWIRKRMSRLCRGPRQT